MPRHRQDIQATNSHALARCALVNRGLRQEEVGDSMFANHLENLSRIEVVHDDLRRADHHQRKGKDAGCMRHWRDDDWITG